MSDYLLIDDDKVFNILSSKVIGLVDTDANINAFLSSAEAIEFIDAEIANSRPLPGVVMIDINMPMYTGFELIDIITKKHPKAFESSKCYILSSSIDERDIQKAKEYPAITGFLEKPLSVDMVKEALTS